MASLAAPAVWDAHLASGVPVFYPTAAEFADFEAYVTRIEPLCGAGLAKVVPPAGWVARCGGYPAALLATGKVRTPIMQQFTRHGARGVFFQTNLEQGTRPLWSFRNHALRTAFRPSRTLRLSLGTQPCAQPWKPAGATDAAGVDLDARVPVCPLSSDDSGSVTATTAAAERRQAYLADMEEQYWNHLSISQPLYGADMLGSLFDPDQPVWNVAALPGLLRALPQRLPGVCEPYLYFGQWRSTFAWHVEDMDLYSINYLHYGAAKQWYVVPVAARAAFEAAAAELFPKEVRECPQFLRHKTHLIAPAVLLKRGLPVHRVIQVRTLSPLVGRWALGAG
jgi:hypothetical protein